MFNNEGRIEYFYTPMLASLADFDFAQCGMARILKFDRLEP